LSRFTGTVICLVLFLLTGCSPSVDLPAADYSRLDSLDATGVVTAYFESGDQATEIYLSPPDERDRRQQPNVVLNRERERGISNLTITGGHDAGTWRIDDERYSEQRQFMVNYTSRRANDIGEPAGPRSFFVYAGQGDDGKWKVLSVGTGP
jgi:hypothetical protein